MSATRSPATPGSDSLAYQEQILPWVSRTFALTIPQLPPELRWVVANLYLLCRIADTIEDESALSVAQKEHFHERLVDAVSRDGDATAFAAELAPLLVTDATKSEKDLVGRSADVIALTRTSGGAQRAALSRCLIVMCKGMARFERNAGLAGLRDLAAFDDYCYCVAGVVGEALTALFCDYSREIAGHREEMLELSISFGQGLQMVNILKDFWDDHDRGVCWLPQSLFRDGASALTALNRRMAAPDLVQAYATLIPIAHAHLRRSLRYVLLIPARETGIRRFCLLALMLAMQTLRLIQRHPGFTRREQVKVSHRAVANTLIMVRLFAGSDTRLNDWFDGLSEDLPRQPAGLDLSPPWPGRIRSDARPALR
ncbi:MAG TPA: squalene/phytoene synthase family protein [Caldimonas sp.]|nr:squalene/phytoene synthase family protein [Caldimonas sp.]